MPTKSEPMKKLTPLAVIALTTCFPLAIQAADGTPLWTNAVTPISGLAAGLASANTIVVDTNGNSYVGGYYINAQGNSDFLTVKYSPTGNVIWARTKDGGAGGNDTVNAVAVDGSGNVYVTGKSLQSGMGSNFQLVKYTSGGLLAFQFNYNTSGNNDDIANALAVNVSGEIFLAGQTVAQGSTSSTWLTTKYTAGGLSWANTFSGAGAGLDQAKAVVADPGGAIYVSGYATDTTGHFGYATVKYSSTGTQLWVNKFKDSTNGDDLVQSMALDGDGNTYLTGIATSAGGSFDYATIKISSGGQTLWTNIYDGPGHSDDEAVAVALDVDENVYVTGTSIGAGGKYGYVTIKYTSLGVPVWTNFFNGIGNRGGQASGLAVDSSGNAYVTGSSFGGLRPDEFVTIKYATRGAPIWTNLYGGGTSASVAADINGNAYVTGNTGGVIATIEYAAALAPLSFVTPSGNSGPVNNHFVLSLTGPVGSNAVISATTNFQTWIPIATNQIPTGTLQVTDTVAPKNLRFYRAQLQ